MAVAGDSARSAPVVVLGAGYGGLTLAQEVYRRSRGRIPLVLVDRSPLHELRTELYELGRIAEAQGDPRPWSRQLSRVLEHSSIQLRTGSVEAIDLDRREVRLPDGSLGYRALAICLGSVAAHFGVPGAAEHAHQVYSLGDAQRCAAALVAALRASASLRGERRPRLVVIGGGSTGTEVSAEIASTDWRRYAGADARTPEVFLLTGALPFLAGLP
ncbi:MAG TPA: FAD-dependent oxidoreductase, partial [Acidimicrobiales bacterium]|nr:FAD-dependent oxidoreductase [Acidimicrobiales bacterium]